MDKVTCSNLRICAENKIEVNKKLQKWRALRLDRKYVSLMFAPSDHVRSDVGLVINCPDA